jgi:hypothetical protein
MVVVVRLRRPIVAPRVLDRLLMTPMELVRFSTFPIEGRDDLFRIVSAWFRPIAHASLALLHPRS